MIFFSGNNQNCIALISHIRCIFILSLILFCTIICRITKEFGGSVQDSLDFSKKTQLLKNESHLCVSNLLDKNSYHFEQWATRSINISQLLSKSKFPNSCTLVQYSIERVVECFDLLYQNAVDRKQPKHVKKNETKTDMLRVLHFVFIGDSRVRQQFFYFLKLVPDYDRTTDPIEIQKNVVSFHHGDVEVQSKILKLRVSFKWRPILNDTIMETLRHWAIYKHIESPNLIFLSIEVHHMLKIHGADFKLYRKNLVELGPILNQLSQVSKVIWLDQYPTIDFYGASHADNTYIHSLKVHQYNEAVHRNLKYGDIEIWDSSNSLAQEYVRGCAIFNQRQIPRDVFVKDGSSSFINCKPYINCEDFIHTGYVALSRATQLLYNDICNSKL